MKDVTTEIKYVVLKFKEETKALLKEFHTTIFGQYPELNVIQWNQYTPYFNDGERCEFGIHGYRLGFSYMTGEFDSEAKDKTGTMHKLDDYWGTVPIEGSPELIKCGYQITQAHELLLGALEDAFGDGVTVTIWRDGTVQTEECEHD